MSDFIDYLDEMLAVFGPVEFRKMFGGYGVFHCDVMIGLIADDLLYFKADAESAPLFVACGCPQFSYQKGRRRVSMSYYLVPEEALEDPHKLADWARLAFAAALRTKQ